MIVPWGKIVRNDKSDDLIENMIVLQIDVKTAILEGICANKFMLVPSNSWVQEEAYSSCSRLRRLSMVETSSSRVDSSIALTAYADTDHAGCQDTDEVHMELEKTSRRLLIELEQLLIASKKLVSNKADLGYNEQDDLYNNLKVYEPEGKGMSSSSSSTQNMAFVSSSNNNTSSTNEAVNTAHGVSTASTQGDILLGSAELPRMKTTRTRSSRRVCLWKLTSTALVSCDGLGGYAWVNHVKEGPKYALMASHL
ncbi:hypothetical protein Tco_0731435 [Tanacetum coccineum]